jgi:hypothetical protein
MQPSSMSTICVGPWCRNIDNYAFPPNTFNACLDEEKQLWTWINKYGGLAAICPGHKWREAPWVKMPPQGKRFSEIKSVPLPPFNGADSVVGSFVVPQGYDGVIKSVIFNYTGTGFQEGSGDISWRLQVNQHYVKDYGNVQTQIGSLTLPYPGSAGEILIQSNDLVQFITNITVAAGGNLTGGRIIASAWGWYWPR